MRQFARHVALCVQSATSATGCRIAARFRVDDSAEIAQRKFGGVPVLSAADHAVAGVKGRHSHSHRSAAARRLQLQDSGLAYVQCDHWRSQARPLGLHGRPPVELDTLLLFPLDHRMSRMAHTSTEKTRSVA